MPLSKQDQNEIESLLSQLSNGELNSRDRERLNELLHQHPDSIDLYLDHCDTEAMLRETYGSLAFSVSPVEPKRRSTRPLWQWVTAAAILVSVVISSQSWWSGSLRSAKRDVPIQQPEEGTGSAKQPFGAVIATITRNSGTQLQQMSGRVVPSEPGQAVRAANYELSGGIIELSYESGATVIFESPAAIDLRSSDSLVLHSGRLSVRCPTEASKGFVVETPSGSAIDLGTEFSVDVDPNGIRDDEFHVFSGEVEINRGSESEGGVPVKEGQALRLDRETSTPTGIDVDHQRFIRGFESPASEYYDRIMSLSPVVYYVMRPKQGGRTLSNETSEDFDAVIHSPTAGHLCYAPGVDGGTSFHLDGAGTHAVVEDYPKAVGDKLSVVAWVYAKSRPSWASIAKNWYDGIEPNERGQFHFGLHSIIGDFRGSLEVHLNDNDDVEQFAIEPTPLPLNQWHHVAMVADGSVLRLYRNGNEVAQTPYNGINGNPSIKALAIGTKLDQSMRPATLNPEARPVSLSQGFWDGCIDHLSIFNSAITAEEILALHELGNASQKAARRSF